MGKPKRPTDANQRAKLVVDIATGEAEDQPEPKASPVEAGRKGGKARASHLSKEERSAAASKAAKARWSRDS